MRPLLTALAILASLAATPTFAYCPPLPVAGAGYASNTETLALCQQSEIAAGVEQQALQHQLDDELRAQLQLLQQQHLRDLARVPAPGFQPSLPAL